MSRMGGVGGMGCGGLDRRFTVFRACDECLAALLDDEAGILCASRCLNTVLLYLVTCLVAFLKRVRRCANSVPDGRGIGGLQGTNCAKKQPCPDKNLKHGRQ